MKFLTNLVNGNGDKSSVDVEEPPDESSLEDSVEDSETPVEENPVVPVFLYWNVGWSNYCNHKAYNVLVKELQEEEKINPRYSLDYVKCSVGDVVRFEPAAVLISSSYRNSEKAAKKLFEKTQCDIYIQLHLENENEQVSPTQIGELERKEHIKGVLFTPFKLNMTKRYNERKLVEMFSEDGFEKSSEA